MMSAQTRNSSFHALGFLHSKPSPLDPHASILAHSPPWIKRRYISRYRAKPSSLSSSSSGVRLRRHAASSSKALSRPLDGITDLSGRSLLVELVSVDPDLETGMEKERVKDYAQRMWQGSEGGGHDEKYECVFEVPEDFGVIGAILLQNQHHTEMFLKDMVLELAEGPVKS